MKHLKSALFLSSVTILAACGGSSDNSTVAASSSSQGENTASLEATYDSTADTLTLSDGATDFVYNRNTTWENGNLRGYSRNATTWIDYAIFGETTSGSGTAAILNSTEDGFEAAAAVIERTGTTDVPTSGVGTYTGDYAGWIFDNIGDDQVTNNLVSGDATLNADFAASSVSGTVTNRLDNSSVGYLDLVFESSTIAGGGFGGTASGGGRTGGSPTTTSGGTYEGFFTGPDGAEIVGSAILEHSSGQTEVGVFIAE